MWRNVALPLLLPGAITKHSPDTSATPHLLCPDALLRQLALNNLTVDNSTVSDGNCGVDAFVRGLSDQATRHTLTRAAKTLLRCDPVARIAQARADATAWLRDHRQTQLWEGMSLEKLCCVVSGLSFDDYLAKMGRDREWIDTPMLHTLGCTYGADICVFQPSMDPALVGQSLMDETANTEVMVPIALVNDCHFWGVCECLDLPIEPIDKGDCLAAHMQDVASQPIKRPRTSVHLSCDPDEDGEDPLQHLHEPETPNNPDVEQRVATELTLCHALARWDPWAAVTEELVQAIGQVAANSCGEDKTLAMIARSHAIQAIAYEEAHSASMPEALKYQRAVCYCLRSPKIIAKRTAAHRGEAVKSFLEARAATKSTEDIAQALEQNCSKGGQHHQCFQPFEPQAILNWRVLWHSLPKVQRKEHLLRMFANDLESHKTRGGGADTWHMKFAFMGYYVCRDAFLRLTGMGASQLQEARATALAGKQSCMANSEIGLYQTIRNTNKAKAYLSARQWLEHYAATHAEWSPMKFGAYLPGARKLFYWHHYREDKKHELEAALKTQAVVHSSLWLSCHVECSDHFCCWGVHPCPLV